MAAKMCVLPVQCRRCKTVFDLWYDLQQQGISGEELFSQQKIGDMRLENLCWRCRITAAEEAKFLEYQQYEENDLENDMANIEIELDFH